MTFRADNAFLTDLPYRRKQLSYYFTPIITPHRPHLFYRRPSTIEKSFSIKMDHSAISARTTGVNQHQKATSVGPFPAILLSLSRFPCRIDSYALCVFIMFTQGRKRRMSSQLESSTMDWCRQYSRRIDLRYLRPSSTT